MIEIECFRCLKNIDEYERVSLVLIGGNLLPIHDTCEQSQDIHTRINARDITQENIVTLIYNVSILSDQREVLMRENAGLRDEKEGMRQEVITMNEKLAEAISQRDDAVQRFEDQRNAIRALWREDATPV